MKEIVEIIQTIGFPITVCIACFYFIQQIIKENREDNKKREEIMFTQLTDITRTLAEISKTLALIDERIEKLEEIEHE
ncbi:MAG: hypothetical protein ACI31M_01000 [Bacilli bacterium]